MIFNDVILKMGTGAEVSREEIALVLDASTPGQMQTLFDRAYQLKLATVGSAVYFRGIIEFSNRCIKDCYYCGIRCSNQKVERYLMNEDEIIKTALWAHTQQYGSLLLQSGERQDPQFIDMITRIVHRIKTESNGKLGITLSLGEQDESTYQAWYEAGAHRYLLRIETSNPESYGRLHPPDHDFDKRLNCLGSLRRVGYQVGTGVMIGLPGQTMLDLADDVIFFRNMDIDMIGMGPYVLHKQTPLADRVKNYDSRIQFELGLKMIAVVRLYLRDVNIAATTALQTLDPAGYEQGLRAGANIMMPNITDTRYRKAYQLYQGKPCLEEDPATCQDCLSSRVADIGEVIGLGKWGDSPHFHKRTKAGAHAENA